MSVLALLGIDCKKNGCFGFREEGFEGGLACTLQAADSTLLTAAELCVARASTYLVELEVVVSCVIFFAHILDSTHSVHILYTVHILTNSRKCE